MFLPRIRHSSSAQDAAMTTVTKINHKIKKNHSSSLAVAVSSYISMNSCDVTLAHYFKLEMLHQICILTLHLASSSAVNAKPLVLSTTNKVIEVIIFGICFTEGISTAVKHHH